MRFGLIRCIISLVWSIQALAVPRHLPGCRIQGEHHAGIRMAWAKLCRIWTLDWIFNNIGGGEGRFYVAYTKTI